MSYMLTWTFLSSTPHFSFIRSEGAEPPSVSWTKGNVTGLGNTVEKLVGLRDQLEITSTYLLTAR